MPEIEALAANILALRHSKNETQAVFAQHCGISEEEVSLLERKKSDPKLSTLQSIKGYRFVCLWRFMDCLSR